MQALSQLSYTPRPLDKQLQHSFSEALFKALLYLYPSAVHPSEGGGVPTGIRTPVPTVKGSCPRPLDDRDTIDVGGGKRDRTADLLHAMQALSQLSYTPDIRET